MRGLFEAPGVNIGGLPSSPTPLPQGERGESKDDLAVRLAADRREALRLVPVSRETEHRLAIYVDLLARWRKSTNLISESTFPSVWTRHIADCAQLVAFAPAAARWVDLGSGAGLPGLVIASQLANVPGAVVHLIESDQRKAAFLREAARVVAVPAEIHAARIEAVDPLKLGIVDAVAARALAPLPQALELARIWLDSGAVGVFPRGRSALAQLAASGVQTEYEIEVFPSAVDPKAAILRIRNV